MNISIIIKKAIAFPLYCAVHLGRYIPVKKRNEYIVLMYHRIKRKNNSDLHMQEGMYVEPNTFRKQIGYLKEKFQIISLERLFCEEDNDTRNGRGKILCALTFDDGWHDFYENAYPTLKEHEVCATVFLPTDYIGTEKVFWTDKLAHILHAKKENVWNNKIRARNHDSVIHRIERLQGPVEFRLEKAIEELKSLSLENIEETLELLSEKWVNLPVAAGRSFLSWNEVREMHESGVVSFGSHTKSHRILTTAKEDVIREELVQSKNALLSAGVVNPSFIPFAYPNGNYTERIAQIVQETGYSIAVTTQPGWNRIDGYKEGKYRINRIGIHQDISSTNSMLGCRIYGIY